jgi:hypothetical protein
MAKQRVVRPMATDKPQVLEEWTMGDERWRIIVTQSRGSDTVELQYGDSERQPGIWWCHVRPDGTPCLPLANPGAMAAISIPTRPGWFSRHLRGDCCQQLDRAVADLKARVAKRHEDLHRGRLTFAEYMAHRETVPPTVNCCCHPEPEHREWVAPPNPFGQRWKSSMPHARIEDVLAMFALPASLVGMKDTRAPAEPKPHGRPWVCSLLDGQHVVIGIGYPNPTEAMPEAMDAGIQCTATFADAATFANMVLRTVREARDEAKAQAADPVPITDHTARLIEQRAWHGDAVAALVNDGQEPPAAGGERPCAPQ